MGCGAGAVVAAGGAATGAAAGVALGVLMLGTTARSAGAAVGDGTAHAGAGLADGIGTIGAGTGAVSPGPFAGGFATGTLGRVMTRPGRSPAQGSRASRNSAAERKRISGFLAIIRVSSTAKVAGTVGLISQTGLGGSQRCRSIFCNALPPANGVLPVSA